MSIKPEFVVWLSVFHNGVIGIDYRELNEYIADYNHWRLYRYVDFWEWFSNECFNDEYKITGLAALNNPNVSKVGYIKG